VIVPDPGSGSSGDLWFSDTSHNVIDAIYGVAVAPDSDTNPTGGGPALPEFPAPALALAVVITTGGADVFRRRRRSAKQPIA
jgi:hypothetical protein